MQDVRFREGRPVVVVELRKATPATSPEQLAQLARELEAAGADALAVPTDALDTSTGLADLLSVCRAVKCPVVRRDWILHPIQASSKPPCLPHLMCMACLPPRS